MGSDSMLDSSGSKRGTANSLSDPLPETVNNMKNHISIDDQTRNSYARVVSTARTQSSSVPIANRYPWHCKIGITELMSLALDRAVDPSRECRIRLLTGTFTDGVYRCVRKSLKKFVETGGKVSVLIWDKEENVGDLPQIDGVEIRCSGTNIDGDELNHFLVVDNDAYRYEAPHTFYPSDQFNDFYPPIPARICFNDPVGGEELVKFFDDLWTVPA